MKILLALIILLPLLGFLTLGLGYRNIPRRLASLIGPGTIILSFVLSLIVFFTHHHTTTPHQYLYFTWISAGDLVIAFSLLADPLSILMLLIVTGIGAVIHVYSVGYMKDDPGYNRFFSFMNLFVFSMLLLVLGSNYAILFIGWEGVGLCSYLLIGFWFRNPEFNKAARKAFIMNRIGDLGFLLGMFLIFVTFGSLEYSDVFAQAKSFQAGHGTVVAITLLLFVGAIGKSAQIPLHTWLPDAMAGPTPVSALIHAATMVTAGVYMVARSGVLYALAPVSMSVIAITGIVTALFAASIAIYQNDIKKVLAYSTISQLGYMFLGLGAGAFTGAMFHLTTHAFFKALLFLGAGSVIHALSGEQDLRLMGGLKKSLPKTYVVFLAGTLAIAGIPPLSGFFSKDEILLNAFGLNSLLWVLGVAGALMTAFYMFRLLFLAFSGEFRGTHDQAAHLHESPGVMIIPLGILAFLSVFGGVINLPGLMGGGECLEHWLFPVFSEANSILAHTPHPSASTEWMLMLITLAGVGLSVWLAWLIFLKQKKAVTAVEEERRFLPRLLQRKYYLDELYDAIIVNPLLRLSRDLADYIEVRVIDRVVEGAGKLVVKTGNTLRYIQNGHVGFYMFLMILGVILILLFNILI